MAIKSVKRPAMVALSPESPYLAAGTAAGQVDESFSTSAHLEIFKLDFQSDDPQLPLLGHCASSQRFYRLSWGKSESSSGEFADGLIAGGLNEGTIGIWNPRPVICSDAGADPLVCQLSRHKGEVHGLEFNSLSPNLLASGADDGEIYIWDLAAPKEVSQFPVLKGFGSAVQSQISYLSWNSKVQHILASTSLNGTTVVWDLKKQKPVLSFSDSTRRKCSILQWNPDVATQVVVASDDDNSPSLRLWDMRNTLQPLREFVGHTKGVLSMSWCPIDSSFLLSSSKDNRTICWDTNSGEIACEFPTASNSTFDIHWYPKIPGIISASSYEGEIGLYNVEACSRYGVGETDFGAAPLRAPKWCRRPVGVSFGFGGKLVSYRLKSSPAGPSGGSSEVYVHDFVTEGSLANRSSEFEAAIRDGERVSLRVLCERKSQEAESEDDRETWGFLKVMFEEDGMARTKLLTHLGFRLPEEAKNTYEDDLSQQVNGISLDSAPDKAEYSEDKETIVLSYDNGEDFFNNLPSPKADTPKSASGSKFDAAETVLGQDHAEAELAGQESSDTAFDDAVQHALVVGDYKKAVTLCISANKMADALVIAHFGGPSLWESTQDQYFKRDNSPYLKVVSAMVNNDLRNLVNMRPVKSWKETLALLCTFAKEEEWTLLCETLASKLMLSGNMLAATLCYICAGNIDKTLEIWSQGVSAEPEGKSYVDSLQDLMEKTIVFALATGQKHFSASLCKLVEKYAEILASQGLLSTAMGYLKLLGEDLTPELMILRDRIALSTEPVKEQPKGRPVYEADHQTAGPTGASQPYYQESTQQLPEQGPSGGPYDQYLSSISQYGRNYPAPPASYQPVQQPQIFLPSQLPQVPQTNYAPPPVSAQPAVKTFIPASSPSLRNVEQYQQPSTLASQLYPGPVNPSYQQGPPGSLGPMATPPGVVPSQKPPQNLPGTTSARGFMPVTNSVVTHRSTPSSPTNSATGQPAPVQPPIAAAQAPVPTIQNVDTANVPAHLRPAVATLTRLFTETSEAFGGSRAGAQKKREIEDNSRKLGSLFDKLNKRDVSNNVAGKLVQLCQALDSGDYGTALQIQVLLTTSDWDECNSWLAALKRMIKVRQSVRL
ncbi:hypothetical protein Dimus_034139 [Dionaea muscipula]